MFAGSVDLRADRRLWYGWKDSPLGVLVTPSSFGKYVATGRTYRTVRGKLGGVSASTRVIGIPVTSNNRNAIRTLISTLGKGVVAGGIANPLGGPIATFCNLVRRGQLTMVRVSTTDNVRFIGRSATSPLRTAACKAKRLVLSTLRHNTRGFVVNLKNSTAGSNNTKVTRTLNIHFLSRSGRRLPINKVTLRGLIQVSRARVSPLLSGTAFSVTYSISYPLAKGGNTDVIFNPRGSTGRARIGLLSGTLTRCTSVITPRLGGTFKTKTTNKLNFTVVTFLGTIPGPNTSLMVSTINLGRGSSSYSLTVAKRKDVSFRATFKGAPVTIARYIGGGSPGYAVINLYKRLKGGISILCRGNFSTLFPVISNPRSLRRTVRGNRLGLAEATRGILELVGQAGFSV